MPMPLRVHPGTCALDLAAAFNDALAADENEAEHNQGVIILAAEYLAETSGPLAWSAFDPAGFFRRLSFLVEEERVRDALTLIGFYHWLAVVEIVRASDALRVIPLIVEAAPASEVLADYAASIRPLLAAHLI